MHVKVDFKYTSLYYLIGQRILSNVVLFHKVHDASTYICINDITANNLSAPLGTYGIAGYKSYLNIFKKHHKFDVELYLECRSKRTRFIFCKPSWYIDVLKFLQRPNG